MPAYLVSLQSGTEASVRANGRDAFVVVAHNTTAAKDAVKSHRDSGNPDRWDNATVTLLAEGDEGDYTFRMRLTFAGDAQPTEFLVGPAADLDALADLMETALEADANVGTNVAVVTGPPVTVTIASGANLGSIPITAELLLGGVPITGLVASVTAASGTAATARVVTFLDQSSNDLPKVHAALTDLLL